MPDANKPPAKKSLSAAERSRKYRERKAAEAAAAAELERIERDEQAASQPSRVMLRATEAAINAMKWIQPSDGALVAQAKLVALQIDMVIEIDPMATGKAASLGQLLTRVLHELGGTPTVRLQHELRSLRAQMGAQQPDGDHGNENQERANGTTGPSKQAGATVTNIRRPAKRKR